MAGVGSSEKIIAAAINTASNATPSRRRIVPMLIVASLAAGHQPKTERDHDDRAYDDEPDRDLDLRHLDASM